MGLKDFLYGVVRKTKYLLLLGIKFRLPESHTTDWMVVMKTSCNENMIKYNGAESFVFQVAIQKLKDQDI
jgi:hypothetical protein